MTRREKERQEKKYNERERNDKGEGMEEEMALAIVKRRNETKISGKITVNERKFGNRRK